MLKPEHKTESLVLTDDHLRNGGYPEVVASRLLTRNYLDTLFDSIIWKDVAKRHNVRNVTELENLAMYLVSNLWAVLKRRRGKWTALWDVPENQSVIILSL